MNQSFSEYILYEPILRILTARGYLVNFEVECPGIAQPRNRDKKRLDLVATCRSSVFAMEVKWKKERSLAPGGDLAKLKAYLNSNPQSRAFLCVFGRQSHLNAIEIQGCTEFRSAVYADFRKTKFGCRIFELVGAAC